MHSNFCVDRASRRHCLDVAYVASRAPDAPLAYTPRGLRDRAAFGHAKTGPSASQATQKMTHLKHALLALAKARPGKVPRSTLGRAGRHGGLLWSSEHIAIPIDPPPIDPSPSRVKST